MPHRALPSNPALTPALPSPLHNLKPHERCDFVAVLTLLLFICRLPLYLLLLPPCHALPFSNHCQSSSAIQPESEAGVLTRGGGPLPRLRRGCRSWEQRWQQGTSAAAGCEESGAERDKRSNNWRVRSAGGGRSAPLPPHRTAGCHGWAAGRSSAGQGAMPPPAAPAAAVVAQAGSMASQRWPPGRPPA